MMEKNQKLERTEKDMTIGHIKKEEQRRRYRNNNRSGTNN